MLLSTECIFVGFILNHFLWSWTGFDLDIETYYLTLAENAAPKSPKIKLRIEFWRLEINSRPISSMHTKSERDRRHKLWMVSKHLKPMFITVSVIYWETTGSVDDNAKDGGPGEVWLLCSFYHEPLRSWIKTNVNKFAISGHTAFKLRTQSLRSYLKVTCEYELHILLNTKVSTAKDHGENYMKARPLLVRHLLRNRLLQQKTMANHGLLSFRYAEMFWYTNKEKFRNTKWSWVFLIFS